MPTVPGGPSFDLIARKWSDLAQRRLDHFVELYSSGRWTHYYRSEMHFAMRMRDVIRAAKIWAELAEPGSSAGLDAGDRLRPAA